MSLAANITLYETCLSAARLAAERGNATACSMIEVAARMAWYQHPGRFADGALENPLLTLAARLPGGLTGSGTTTERVPAGRKRTLHVASEVLPSGGHTRVLSKWLLRDRTSPHHLVLTRQWHAVPDFLQSVLRDTRTELTILEPRSPAEARARKLREISRNAARIVLHHSPDDSVPVLAYAADLRDAPIIWFNHAHFSFSLGPTVADLVLNTLPVYAELARRRRGAQVTSLLQGPFELKSADSASVDKPAAKQRLGLPAESPVALTIGNRFYYTPQGDQDFFRFALRLLHSNKALHFLFVGVEASDPNVRPELRTHERAHFYGVVADPHPYYLAADVCLDAFPLPSIGATLESVLYGEAFPVLAYAETESIVRPSIPGMPARPSSAQAHFALVERLLSHARETREAAAELRKVLTEWDRRFGDQFEGIYATAAGAVAPARRVPEQAAQWADEDLAQAEVCGDHFLMHAQNLPTRWLRVQALGRGLLRRHLSVGDLITIARQRLKSSP